MPRNRFLSQGKILLIAFALTPVYTRRLNKTPGLELHRAHIGHGFYCPGLGLGAPLKDFRIFQWKCPLQNENVLSLSKLKVQAKKHHHIEVGGKTGCETGQN